MNEENPTQYLIKYFPPKKMCEIQEVKTYHVPNVVGTIVRSYHYPNTPTEKWYYVYIDHVVDPLSDVAYALELAESLIHRFIAEEL